MNLIVQRTLSYGGVLFLGSLCSFVRVRGEAKHQRLCRDVSGEQQKAPSRTAIEASG